MIFFPAFLLGSAFGMILMGVILAKITPDMWESSARMIKETKEKLGKLKSIREEVDSVRKTLRAQFFCEKCETDLKPYFEK